MDPRPMLSSHAHVATAMPRRYLTQLCKHFQHRLPVTLAENHGQIDFPSGTCTLRTEPETLVLQVTAVDDAALASVQDVVARHLARFAFREPPQVNWRRLEQ